ncbi:myb-like protein Q [Anopheles merus]|uniref:C2H2-type domain-containing protein n=1 Tax=Anopheles merus TaxID=30066 RepID=A0A182V3V6_ANOME|nr:myb-like protein Q [Anopheles merus]XP_041764114.1 myb-like protein Q [Anopheles merus]XP_041764115.1 myb-like protein Q [Anopheles merus]XP_041764116.1 myb-like protein Q [Anopheles merus]XP_041764117.1 myb-like protein Q [Anopheles merus]XP_041764118.1 myb-like protein Q [Anopheles merus]
MHMLELITDIAMASSSSPMEISEPFRTEDLSKTDFFDFVTGSAPDMAISSSSSSNSGSGGPGGGGGGGSGANNSSSSGSSSNTASNSNTCNRVLAGGLPSMGVNGVPDRPPGGRNGGEGSPMDGAPANRVAGSTVPDANDQPLQGFDQFWGPDKDANRLDPAMFEDLNRYCWIQQSNTASAPASNSTSNNATNSNTNNSNNGALNNQVADTDGQIYTLTVLNGAPEPWVLRKDPNGSEPAAPASNLDLDTILGGFPGYVKTECFSYDDSGFGTDHHAKEDPHHQQQQQQQQQQHQHLQLVQQHAAHHAHTQPQLQQVQSQQQQQQMPVTSSNIVLSSQLLDPNSVLAYQNNNNNDWQMSDHNVIQQDTAESLLRSALQGKGYTKGTGLPLPNGTITVLPATGHMKDEELRRVLYSGGDPNDSLAAYADSTLASTMYDESVLHSPASTNQSATSQQQQQQHQQHQHQQQLVASTGQVTDLATGGPGGPGTVVVDDMFFTLDTTFPEDYEKLKRIATEVQQFCTDNNNYTEIIVEAPAMGNGCSANVPPNALMPSANNHQHHTLGVLSPTGTVGSTLNRQPSVSTTSSDVVTTTSSTKPKAPRAKKSYKRSLSNSAAGAANSNNNNNGSTLNCLTNNNNNNTSMSNLNTIASGGGAGAMLSPGSANGTVSLATTTTTSTTTNTATTSPTQCGNGQRKERSLHYCSICSKGFKDKYSVNVHIRTHTGEKPFACSLCGKSFRQKAHLAKHYQTHLAQKNPPGGTVTKQSKQSRLSTPLAASAAGSDPSTGQSMPVASVTPVTLSVVNVAGPLPPMVIPQAQSPPMLLTATATNNNNTNTATIVASR